MIVQCPNCQSKSRVDDAGAARGARVRCASCAHVFLPNTAIVAVKAAPHAAAPAIEEQFSGKTSLFTGVVSREAIGLGMQPAPQPMTQETTIATAAPHKKPSPPQAAPAADAGEGFGSNRTQAIDVSQLAAFSAKMPGAQDKNTAPSPQAKAAPAAKPQAQRTVGLAAAPVPTPAPARGTSDTTDVIGTHEAGLKSAGVTTASRVLWGMSAVLMLCGLIFFSAGHAVYAALGLMGGSAIDIEDAQLPDASVVQVTSTLYMLADGHEALVALGSIVNPGSQTSSSRMEVLFAQMDDNGAVITQARGPIGAVLSLEELATLTLPDSAAAELRRRVQKLPPMAPKIPHPYKFMAVIKDPKHPLAGLKQKVTLLPALAADFAPVAQPPAAAATLPPVEEPIVDPELPQLGILPQAPTAESALPAVAPVKAKPAVSAVDAQATPDAPVRLRKKSNVKAKKRR